ncbi:MAG: hypothetical protein C7B44_05875 [Sulfobacillus thermosulfidooxidans]|nr:hypothetical protein CO251_16990 [Sulfobacillus sp. hq2]PSR37031.1 MAG: hypothetical protein C7B44_05875 [Sulfobacillus thermosulfidooxidans]
MEVGVMTWRNWTMAVMGAWFALSAWVLNPMHSSPYFWTAIILGGLVLIGSLWELVDNVFRPSVYYLEALFGLYLGLSPFVYSFTRHGWATAITTILGAAIFVGGLWQARTKNSQAERTPDHPNHRVAS